jgi:hypothetical protein
VMTAEVPFCDDSRGPITGDSTLEIGKDLGNFSLNICRLHFTVGRGSTVGIGTCYKLDSLGIESR